MRLANGSKLRASAARVQHSMPAVRRILVTLALGLTLLPVSYAVTTALKGGVPLAFACGWADVGDASNTVVHTTFWEWDCASPPDHMHSEAQYLGGVYPLCARFGFNGAIQSASCVYSGTVTNSGDFTCVVSNGTYFANGYVGNASVGTNVGPTYCIL